MGGLVQDIRYAVRVLAKSPGFTAVAVLTLALGIGANSALFSVVNSVLFRPLPFPQSDDLMAIESIGAVIGPVSFPEVEDLRKESRSFQSVEIYGSTRMTLTGAGEPLRVQGSTVSPNLFVVLQVRPALGRNFLPEEDKAGSRPLILSHSLWQSRFGGKPDIVGQAATLDSESYVIVGVMPPGFRFPLDLTAIDFWTTTASYRGTPIEKERGNHSFSALGRLQPGISVETAHAEVAALAARIEKDFPADKKGIFARVVPLKETLVGETRRPMLILLGAVGFVLLIGCANVANLLMARATARRREIAVRAALGASRARVIRQLLTESLLMALAGGAAGLLLASWGTEALVALGGSAIPRADEIRVDATVLWFTLGASMLAGVIFGVLPALQTSRTNLAESLKEGARHSGNLRSTRWRDVLVAGEVALASVLLVGAGLLIQSLWRLQQVQPGFDARNVLTMRVGVPDAQYPTGEKIGDFYQRLQERVAALPGVQSAAAIVPMPLSGMNIGVGFSIEGRPVPADEPFPFGTQFRAVLPRYFATVHIPLIAGRDFNERDRLGAPAVAVINQAFAQKYFPNENPLGRRVNPSIATTGTTIVMREIVGVVGNVKFRSPRAADQPEIYVPQSQFPLGTMTLVVRAAQDAGLAAAVRREVQALDAQVPVFEVKPMNAFLASSTADARFQTLLLGAFSGVALLLTAVGLYGVISYSVTQRTHEIGIRMALGAQRGNVLRMVMARGAMLIAIGAGVGIAGALALTQSMTKLLFGVKAADPATFVAGVAVLCAVALLACWIPARRATKVDPLVALRYE